MNRFLSSLSAFALALTPSLCADTVSPGYTLASESPTPAAISSSAALLSDGSFVSYDGSSLDLYSSTGDLILNLGNTGAGFAFASFVIVDPTESFVVVGDTPPYPMVGGELWRADLGGGNFESMGSLAFNFAATFETANTIIVSAAAGTFGTNSLVRIDTDTFTQTTLGVVPGPSGPVAVDAAGTLYYAPQSSAFPTPAGSVSIVNWTAAQIQGGAIDENNWNVFASGLNGSASLVVEPVFGNVFLAETVYNGTNNRILEFAQSGELLGEVANGGSAWISAIRFVERGGPGAFGAYQPSGGVDLVYSSTDFSSFRNTVVVEPARPTLTLAGPGMITGVGRVDVSVQGVDPTGYVKFWRGNTVTLSGSELQNELGLDFLVHSTIPSATLQAQAGPTLGFVFGFFGRWNYAFGTSASSAFENRSAFAGDIAIQAIVIDAQGRVRGTTEVATN